MKSKKMLHIKECYFNLPDNFNGTFADALVLMANLAVHKQIYNEINKYQSNVDINLYEHLTNIDECKCVVDYEFI